MFKKAIGILGGMGPVASADTYVELIRLCQEKYGSVQDADFPKVILYSLPLAEFDHHGFTDDVMQRTAILNQLTDALQKLEQAGAELIVIDCNTVHYFFTELQASVSVPIINLIETTVEDIISKKYTAVAVLCSQASRDVGLYTKPLEQAGVQVLAVSEAEQGMINEAILAVMGGSVTSAHIGSINVLLEKFAQEGAQCVILGCTEISNIAKRLSHKAVLVDSEVLAVTKALELAQ